MTSDTFPYRYTINAAQIVDKDQHLQVVPDAGSLERIARAYEIGGIARLVADFTLKPYRKAGVRVAGTIDASITQTCVVSLEPFESAVFIEVDRTFEPHSTRPRRARDLNEDGEIEIDLESVDPPDVITDGVLDLGAVICEELALVLDPFPRRPGVEFEGGEPESADAAADEPDKPSPFSALAALKRPPEG